MFVPFSEQLLPW